MSEWIREASWECERWQNTTHWGWTEEGVIGHQELVSLTLFVYAAFKDALPECCGLFVSPLSDNVVKHRSVIHRVGGAQLTKELQLAQVQQAVLDIQNGFRIPAVGAWKMWQRNYALFCFPPPPQPLCVLHEQKGLLEPPAAKPEDVMRLTNDPTLQPLTLQLERRSRWEKQAERTLRGVS